MERRKIEYTVHGKDITVHPIDSIQCATDAYTIGFLAMDGSYIYMNRHKKARMGLTSSTKYVIDGIISEYMPKTVATDRSNEKQTISTPNGKVYHYDNLISWELDLPIKFTESLYKFGIAKHKPERVLAGIPRKFMGAYFLGVLDADGWFRVNKYKNNLSKSALSVIVSSSAMNILVALQREFEDILEVPSSIIKRRNVNVADFAVWKTKNAIKVGNWMYADLPKFYNHKKKNIFDTYCASCVSSGELLESESRSAAKPSETEGSETT